MQTATRLRTVKVGDWKHSRKIRVDDASIKLEVARTDDNCHECPTCVARANKVAEFLLSGSYVWAWEFEDNGKWLCLARTDGTEPTKFLADAIGLSIDGTAPKRDQPRRYSRAIKLANNHTSRQVWVGTWENRRYIIAEPGRVLFQVTANCNHCSICADRVRYVQRALGRRPDVIHRWEYVEGYGDKRWISIPRRADQDPYELVREVLNLHIEF